MKSVKFGLAILVAVFFTSCLDTEEKIVLNTNNSGTYSMTLDMGRMLKMASSMGSMNANTEKAKEKKDTTVYLKDLLDSAGELTPREKALYRDGLIHVVFDEAKDEMKIVMSSPFKNSADLTEIKNNFSTVMNKLKAFEKATGEKDKEEDGDMKFGSKSANPVGDQFTFVAGANKISNTITNIDAFKNLVSRDSSLSSMMQMTSMMGDLNYRTIIVLPKAVKNYQGPGSTVSGDKKTVTFFTTLSEMLEHPEKVSYKVEY